MLRDEEARPGIILVGFTLAMAMVALFTVVDAQRKSALEVVVEPSSLGDYAYIPDATSYKVGDEVVRYQQQPLFLTEERLIKIQGEDMIRLEQTDDGNLFLYRERPKENEAKPRDPNEYFVKVNPIRYLRLSTEPPQDDPI